MTPGPEAEAGELRTLLAISELRGEVVERLVAVETRLEGVETILASQAPPPTRAREATRASTIGAAAAGAIIGLGELVRRFIG